MNDPGESTPARSGILDNRQAERELSARPGTAPPAEARTPPEKMTAVRDARIAITALALEVPAEIVTSVREKVEVAFAALAAEPRQLHGDPRYQYPPPSIAGGEADCAAWTRPAEPRQDARAEALRKIESQAICYYMIRDLEEAGAMLRNCYEIARRALTEEGTADD